MSSAPTRLALKIDVDTYQGTRRGVPGLLEELERAGVRASFFLSLGPDRSGRAVLRVFRKRGFLAKMLRTNPARMYGLRTMLYGTLLPAPRIAQRLADTLRAIRTAGHEVGLHAWDHVLWQDELHRLAPEQIHAQLQRGCEAFEALFGERPRLFAAPAWYITAPALAALEEHGFEVISVSRDRGGPLRPSMAGRRFSLLEIPTTLPTLDEALGRDGIDRSGWNKHLLSLYRPGHTEVLTIHAETEGMAFRPEFRELLERHRERGVVHLTLGEIAAEARASELPVRAFALGSVPGRAGEVTVVRPAPA